jgi:hypothetical protein
LNTSAVTPCELPEDALLRRYSVDGSYADCYVATTAAPVSHAAFVEAFYTTPLFKLERMLLKWFAGRPSTDEQARQLATGTRDSFAAWSVEARSADQLLLADVTGRTKSWLMSVPAGNGAGIGTRLLFGSAIVAVARAESARRSPGTVFRVLLRFHKLYSHLLLRAAKSRLEGR